MAYFAMENSSMLMYIIQVHNYNAMPLFDIDDLYLVMYSTSIIYSLLYRQG